MNTPYYIVYEEKLRRNLDLITYVMKQSQCALENFPHFPRIWHPNHSQFGE